MSIAAANSLERKQVVVAMSGGVDSSVAALLLREAGHDVVGVSMQVWDYRNHGGCESRATCCAPDDFTDARKVASKIGVPYYVFDFEKNFKKEVIDKFVDSYLRGFTPNPCVDCNSKVKFRELRDRAHGFGCSFVATGHYARIVKSAEGARLLRAKDKNKDQSYFLYGIKPEELESTLFPIGDLTKPEVREIARSHGLVTAEKPESQDVCFVSGEVGDFVSKISKRKIGGEVVSSQGASIGRHDGIQNFTVGQRRGLKIGGSEKPLYVLEIDAANQRVIVGDRADLKREGFKLEHCSWLSPSITQKLEAANFPISFEALAQVRYRHKGVKVRVEIDDFERARVFLLEEWTTISPGQAGVIFDRCNEELLGGGTISASF